MSRLGRIAGWVTPPILLVVFHWDSLFTWFQADDFAFLDLARRTTNSRELWEALFRPSQHGTLRPFSERGFFVLFHALFGLDALPYRIWVFLTQIGSLTLLNAVARRLSGSAAAGFWAALFWAAHARLATVLSWTCAYLHVLCGFCLLLALYAWLRYTETGRRGWWLAVWGVFLFGFGVMEMNIVFPGLVVAHAVFLARPYWRRGLALIIPSAMYVVLHMTLVPKSEAGPYSIRVDERLIQTTWTYWKWVLDPALHREMRFLPGAPLTLLVALLSASLVGYAAASAVRRRWLPAVLLLWFLILLAPVLPFPGHLTEYYLAVPVAALAMLAGCTMAAALRAGSLRTLWRGAALVCAGLFLYASAPAVRRISQWNFERGELVRRMVLGVIRVRQLHPRETILLHGVDTLRFWGGVRDGAFRAAGVHDVFLTPGSETGIEANPALCDISDYELSYEVTRLGLEQRLVRVYAVQGGRLRNITTLYRPPPESRGSRGIRLELGSRAVEALLGPGWQQLEPELRWTSARATLRLPGPFGEGQKLRLLGFCFVEQLEHGPVGLNALIDGLPAPAVRVTEQGWFRFAFPLPDGAAGRESLDLALEVDRTVLLREGAPPTGLALKTIWVN